MELPRVSVKFWFCARFEWLETSPWSQVPQTALNAPGAAMKTIIAAVILFGAVLAGVLFQRQAYAPTAWAMSS